MSKISWHCPFKAKPKISHSPSVAWTDVTVSADNWREEVGEGAGGGEGPRVEDDCRTARGGLAPRARSHVVSCCLARCEHAAPAPPEHTA